LENLYEAATLERLEGGGQRGSIHGEQGGYWGHGRGLGAIEGHEERELSIGEAEGAQGFIESPGQGAGGALNMETETGVANEESGFIRKQLGT
jgi:hypothetical protein